MPYDSQKRSTTIKWKDIFYIIGRDANAV